VIRSLELDQEQDVRITSDSVSADPLVLGARIRHVRRDRRLTLDEAAGRIGKTAPFLSLVENGKRRLSSAQLGSLAEALGVPVDDLLDPTPPSRRAWLEIALQRAQAHPRYRALGVPPLRTSARLPDEALEHLVALFDALLEREATRDEGSHQVQRADAAVGAWLRDVRGHLPDIEAAARTALARMGYEGSGPITTRHLLDLSTSLGFELLSVDDLPPGLRAVVDEERHRLFIPQRNELRTRQARKAVLQTLGTSMLEHGMPKDLETWFRMRVESAYFAAAVLVPEPSAIPFLMKAKADRDLSVEDLREAFYVSYEMAGQRFANLAPHHLGIDVHALASDADGIVWKWLETDGAPLPRNRHGGVAGMRLCRSWGARRVFASDDRFALHEQYTDTPSGTFWSSTHLETAGEPLMAVTVGVGFADARWFRGRDTSRHELSSCPDGPCCLPEPPLPESWEATLLATSRAQRRIVGLSMEPWPTPDEVEVAEFLARHA
jgi:XRE family transcriptional regulator, fatty acid utilization regulator